MEMIGLDHIGKEQKTSGFARFIKSVASNKLDSVTLKNR